MEASVARGQRTLENAAGDDAVEAHTQWHVSKRHEVRAQSSVEQSVPTHMQNPSKRQHVAEVADGTDRKCENRNP